MHRKEQWFLTRPRSFSVTRFSQNHLKNMVSSASDIMAVETIVNLQCVPVVILTLHLHYLGDVLWK